jgi:hypothetical protein
MQKRLSNIWGVPLLAALLATALPSTAQAGQPENVAASMPKVGEMAPDFTLNYFDGNDLKEVSLSQYRGKKNVVVGFFVFAFTGG